MVWIPRGLQQRCVNSLKERLDLLLVQQGFYPTREKARNAIMAGQVYVNKQISDKAGTSIPTDAQIEIMGEGCPYVSKGGLKLEKALQEFGLNLDGAIAMDIGASTGGFTDCMLQHGACKVYAVDVGYGQLDWKLRNDQRVINMEKVNIRHLDPLSIPDRMDLISIDVSFISLQLVLPVAVGLLAQEGDLICLVKPQFEAGREQIGKNGIVRDPKIHLEVLGKVQRYAAAAGLQPKALTFSPRTGAKGNIEYLMWMKKGHEREELLLTEQEQKVIVGEAHRVLGKVEA